MYTEDKFNEMITWIFEHTESWYDYFNALRHCGFSYREVMELQEEWGCGSDEEEQEIKEALADVF